jgi:hypothetical protein
MVVKEYLSEYKGVGIAWGIDLIINGKNKVIIMNVLNIKYRYSKKNSELQYDLNKHKNHDNFSFYKAL